MAVDVGHDGEPPDNHSILWLAVGKGRIRTPETIEHGEIAVFEYGTHGVELLATEDSEFLVGSATPHPHKLVLGYYSVHTSERALEAGESHIKRIRDELIKSVTLPLESVPHSRVTN